MNLHFFNKPKSSKPINELHEQHIINAIDQFKKDPLVWDEIKMGSEDEIKQSISNRLNTTILKKQKLKITYRKMFSAVASIAIIGVFVWLGYQFKGQLLDEFYPANIITVKTHKNEVRKISLEDGSIVWLNGNTSISYPDRFNHVKREVVLLEGEAYFDIHHDDKKPFQVKAGKTLTNVLGTSFNISAYKWLKTINVTVATGKVAVNNHILLPNDQFLYNKSSNRFVTKKLKSNYVSSWIAGQLTFNDEDFKTVATILENKFNVSISFSDKAIEDYHFTARYEPQDKLQDIIADLAITRGLSYKINGSKIIINN